MNSLAGLTELDSSGSGSGNKYLFKQKILIDLRKIIIMFIYFFPLRARGWCLICRDVIKLNRVLSSSILINSLLFMSSLLQRFMSICGLN